MLKNRIQRDSMMIDGSGVLDEIQIPVQLVTIKSKIPLFKGEDKANAIEKIELEENGFSLVAQKDLYDIGEQAVYIQPDFSLSDISLFDSFIRPFGEAKKSKLGSNFRIRAVKFNLHTGNNEPTYSVGILLPLNEVLEYVSKLEKIKVTTLTKSIKESGFNGEYFTKSLGITKWTEPDTVKGNGTKTNGGREFPSGLYKTDENNINNVWSRIHYPIRLIGTQKKDGSSISLIFKNGNYDIASRNLIKNKVIEKVVGRKNPSLLDRFLILFGYKPNLLIKQNIKNDDDFILLAEPYVNKIIEHYKGLENVPNMVLRGEANGQKWKGSGNKNNPSNKLEPNIKFFGIDDYSTPIATKLYSSIFHIMMLEYGFETCETVFDKVFETKEEIIKDCEAYFKNNLIEGIVLRSEDSKFSAKYMNNEYDSKK